MDQQGVTTVLEERDQRQQFFAQRPASKRDREPEVVELRAAGDVEFADAPGTSPSLPRSIRQELN
jgi:hypothetical protein